MDSLCEINTRGEGTGGDRKASAGDLLVDSASAPLAPALSPASEGVKVLVNGREEK